MKKDLKPKLNPRKPCNSPCTNCLAQAAVEGAIAGVQRPENQQTGSGLDFGDTMGTTYTSMQNEESGHIYFLNVGLSVYLSVCLSVSLPVCMHARIYRRICIRWVCVCVSVVLFILYPCIRSCFGKRLYASCIHEKWQDGSFSNWAPGHSRPDSSKAACAILKI